MNKSKIIVVVGPTASGKSDLGIKIAKKLGGEVISADSRQVYRGMDIGTGKVPRDRIRILDSRLSKSKIKNLKPKIYYSEGIRHYLIDVVSPKKQFTVSDFKKLGEKAIEEIWAKGKMPIIVGGTGLYIDVLLGRMQIAEVPPNKKLRAQLDKLTAEKLFEKLVKLDPRRAKIIDRHNKRRLIRAIEIYSATKESSLNTRYKIQNTRYKILWLGINPGKEKLANRIKRRLDKRLKEGMIKEVKKLHNPPAGGGVSWKQLDNFGLEYKWISLYLQKKIAYKEMRENLLKDIIRYSKRQMTWFKRNKDIHWVKNKKATGVLVATFLKDKIP